MTRSLGMGVLMSPVTQMGHLVRGAQGTVAAVHDTPVCFRLMCTDD